MKFSNILPHLGKYRYSHDTYNPGYTSVFRVGLKILHKSLSTEQYMVCLFCDGLAECIA
jgi:hypothetical protein